MGVFILTFAFTQGVFPKPPDFANLGAFDLSFFAGHLRFTLFLHHGARRARAGRLRAALAPRAGVLGARAPGPDDPARPPPLLPRGLARAARRLVLSLHRVLVPARRLQHRRLGEERAARARRQRGGRGGAVHARRRGRAAGVPRQGLRRHRVAARRSPPTRSASRSRSRRSRSRWASSRSWAIFQFRSFKDVIAAGRADREGSGADAAEGRYCRPCRASRTSVTASGKTVAITVRICSACSAVVPWMLTRRWPRPSCRPRA